MNAVNQATRPDHNITVSASAGSGKTWMLVTRIIRLLLAGNPPDGILAITFTRKAAAEMQQRLMDRLFELATLDDASLAQVLENMAIDTSQQTLSHVRSLYERLLHSRQQPTITTFHAFAQHLLRRFPLEADVVAAFELVEQDALLIKEAWDALMNEATRQPESELSTALSTLYELTGGVHNTSKALHSFLAQRSDWWAYTHGNQNPVQYGHDQLVRLFAIPPNPPGAADFFLEHATRIEEYASLLRLHENKTTLSNAATAESCLGDHNYAAFRKLFYTTTHTIRVFKSSGASIRSRGEDNENRLLALHEELLLACDTRDDLLNRIQNAQLNSAWYLAGNRLLEYYQGIKATRRVLDFSDLEWKAYCLLNTHDNAHWIQYKLDQRIDHLLVDEFQDTNPVQWRLLLPLLEELAAAEPERQRSVFLVGDAKQAIYGFRRADAGLFDQAREWLQGNLDATDVPLSDSRRSSPAVIDFLNEVFSDGELHGLLPDFQTHGTYQQNLWGQVEILPVFTTTKQTGEAPQAGLRDPLTTPLPLAEDTPTSIEAEAIASRIASLIESGLLVEDRNGPRPVCWSDIMILLRTRNAAASYETALRHADIPYFGTERGTLFNCVEIQDMLALLDCLLTPYNNLAIARVLRSPVFDLDEDHLARIALQARQHNCGWFDALQKLASDPANTSFMHTWHLLAGWHNLVGKLPVHDLLDRIYSEASILERFQAACPPHQRRRVHANLVRFLVLALEIDSGRYPSVEQFRNHLRNLHKHAAQQMHNAQASGDDNRVRIMTIHESKGLEAPIVFVADTAHILKDKSAWSALVNWRINQAKPDAMLLLPKGQLRSRILQDFQASQQYRDNREEANLLYVALSRAKHMLVISANTQHQDKLSGWYQQLVVQLGTRHPEIAEEGYLHSNGTQAYSTQPASESVPEQVYQASAEVSSQPLLSNPYFEIAPSRHASTLQDSESISSARIDEPGSFDGRLRGVILHGMLEQLSSGHPLDDQYSREIASQYGQLPDSPLIVDCMEEARRVFTAPEHHDWFDNGRYTTVKNEIPLIYQDPDSGQTVNGVIDRLLVTDGKIIIIDYKTHQQASPQTIPGLAETLQGQLEWYRKGISLIYPGREVECWLLFTRCNQAVRTA